MLEKEKAERDKDNRLTGKYLSQSQKATLSSRPLPHRFLFRPVFSIRAALNLTLGTTKEKIHTQNKNLPATQA